MKLKYVSIFLLVCVAILSACSQSNQEVTAFTEAEAIQLALNLNNSNSTNFPTTPGTKKLETTIGGKAGTTANLEVTTKVERKDNETFVVTFLKDWNVKVGNKDVVSYWEYQVTSEGATLIKSEDNENLVATIK